MFQFRSLSCLAITTAFVLSCTGMAQAGGFGSSKSKHQGASLAKAYSKNYARLKSKKTYLKANSFARISTKSLYGGKVVKANAHAGNNLKVIVNGKKCSGRCGAHTYISASNRAKSKIWVKGKKVFGKAQAINYVKLHSKGKLLFEYESDSYALGNFTPAGAYMDAATFAKLNLAAKGFVHLSSGGIAKASVTVK